MPPRRAPPLGAPAGRRAAPLRRDSPVVDPLVPSRKAPMSLRTLSALSRPLARYLRLGWLSRLLLSLAGCVRNGVKALFPGRPPKAPPKRPVKLALLALEGRLAPDD